MLLSFSWPGNVRQLQNVVRNIVVLHEGDLVLPEMIPPPVNRHNAAGSPEARHAALSEPVRFVNVTMQPLPIFPPPIMPPQTPSERLHAEVEPLSTIPLPSPVMAGTRFGTTYPDHAVDPDLEVIPLAEMERRMVFAALARTDKDIPRAAALLQVNPSTVYRKVSAWRKDGLVLP